MVIAKPTHARPVTRHPTRHSTGLASLVSGLLALAVGLLAAGPAGAQLAKPPPKPSAPETPKIVAVKPRAGEVRATWLRWGEGDYLATPAKTADTMKRLREIGFNTVYVSVWQDGLTLYPSEVFNKAAGVRISPMVPGGRDLLLETLIEAHRNGLLMIATFEGGLVASPVMAQNPLRQLKKDWLLRDAKGSEAAVGAVWLNPLHEEVRTFFADLLSEVADRYDIDGIQLDEKFCWGDPTLGYDDTTKSAYAKEAGGQGLPANPRDPAFLRWRMQKATFFVRDLCAKVREKRPGLILSMGATTPQASADSHLCDWPGMARMGLFDEFAIRCLRPDVSAFKAAWAETQQQLGGRRVECVVGLRAMGEGGPDLPWSELQQEIAAVREANGAGYSITSSKAVLFTQAAALTDFFSIAKNGRVRHPLRGLEWRPGPLKPERLNYKGDYLLCKGLPDNLYRAIIGGKEPGAWIESPVRFKEGMSKMSKEAAASLQAGGATVEFLIDRRAENLAPIPDPNAPPPEPEKPREPRRRPAAPPKGG